MRNKNVLPIFQTLFFFISVLYYISPCSIVQQCIVSSNPNKRVLYDSIVCMPMG